MKGNLFDIQRYSLQDGPGIRTTVFLKGCPLRCLWCHNPESQNPNPEISFTKTVCQECGACEQICPRQACSLLHPLRVDRTRCTVCGLCLEHCPASALAIIGRKVTVEEIGKEAAKDELFYRQSGGGVTLSGGEPLTQFDFVSNLVLFLKQQGHHLALDTSGYHQGNARDLQHLFSLVPSVDLFLYDLKLIDDHKHQKYTGVSNRTILEQAVWLETKYPHKTIFRYPLIPGINDSPPDIDALKEFLSQFPGCSLEILPYHQLGMGKHQLVGKACQLEQISPPPEDQVSLVKKRLIQHSRINIL